MKPRTDLAKLRDVRKSCHAIYSRLLPWSFLQIFRKDAAYQPVMPVNAVLQIVFRDPAPDKARCWRQFSRRFRIQASTESFDDMQYSGDSVKNGELARRLGAGENQKMEWSIVDKEYFVGPISTWAGEFRRVMFMRPPTCTCLIAGISQT